MPSITNEIMEGAMHADYFEIRDAANQLLSEIQGSNEVHITSPQGTNLTLEIGSREWHPDTGICHEAGGVTNLPAGEVYVAPESGDGTLVVDGSMAGLGRVEKPIDI
ncbi:MAG: aminopeptidase, partial [Halobacteria archaeon]|nr:aminopeptidase [Halobacteria archaeon]